MGRGTRTHLVCPPCLRCCQAEPGLSIAAAGEGCRQGWERRQPPPLPGAEPPATATLPRRGPPACPQPHGPCRGPWAQADSGGFMGRESGAPRFPRHTLPVTLSCPSSSGTAAPEPSHWHRACLGMFLLLTIPSWSSACSVKWDFPPCRAPLGTHGWLTLLCSSRENTKLVGVGRKPRTAARGCGWESGLPLSRVWVLQPQADFSPLKKDVH